MKNLNETNVTRNDLFIIILVAWMYNNINDVLGNGRKLLYQTRNSVVVGEQYANMKRLYQVTKRVLCRKLNLKFNELDDQCVTDAYALMAEAGTCHITEKGVAFTRDEYAKLSKFYDKEYVKPVIDSYAKFAEKQANNYRKFVDKKASETANTNTEPVVLQGTIISSKLVALKAGNAPL